MHGRFSRKQPAVHYLLVLAYIEVLQAVCD
jgi:hypothetical protein